MSNPHRILNIFKAHFTWKGALGEPTSIGIHVGPLYSNFQYDRRKEVGAQKMIRGGFELYNTKSGLDL